MRKLCEKTQVAYVRAVRKLAAYLKRSPDTASTEELRRFQLHLVDHGTSPATLNATIMGLKFFFDVTLNRGELMAKMQSVRMPRTLPVVLSRDEVARLIAAAPNLKTQTALSVAYGTGLRASEVILGEAALRQKEVEEASKETEKARAEIKKTEKDLERLREHLKALGKDSGAGPEGNPLVKRMLEAEDRLSTAQKRQETLDADQDRRRDAVRKVLERLPKTKDKTSGT